MKKRIVIIVLIIILIFLGYHYRYTPFFYIQKFYEYRISKSIKAGKFIKAEQLYKNKLFFCITVFSKELTINEMIRFYINQRMYTKAEELYSIKLNNNMFHPIYGCSNGANKLDLGDLYNSIAILYLNMGEYNKAEKYVNKSLDIFKNWKEQSNILDKFVKSYETLSLIHTATQDYQKAKEYSKKIKYYAQQADKGEELFFSYYNAEIHYYNAIKDYNNAEIYTKKMYSAIPSTLLPLPFQSQVNNQNNYIIYINSNLGKFYYLQNKYTDAERIFSIAYKISNELYGEFHPDTFCNGFYLSYTYKKENKNELYKYYLKKTKQNAKNYKVLNNAIGKNFETNIKDFCNIYK